MPAKATIGVILVCSFHLITITKSAYIKALAKAIIFPKATPREIPPLTIIEMPINEDLGVKSPTGTFEKDLKSTITERKPNAHLIRYGH